MGRALVYSGLALVAMAVYLVFATVGIEARAQRDLRGEFRDLVRSARASSTTTTTTGVTAATTTPVAVEPAVPSAAGPGPARGAALARLQIPSIGLDRIVVEGVDTAELRRGPGHYPGTARPGERGNVAIAGHRTTYGAPFGDIDRLEPGDEILLTTASGRTFRYEVTGSQIVAPTDVSVLDDRGDAEAPVALAPHATTPPVGSVAPDTADDLLAGTVSSGAPVGWWGWFVLGALANEARFRWRRWHPGGRSWAVGGAVVIVAVALWTTWRGLTVAADLIQWNL